MLINAIFFKTSNIYIFSYFVDAKRSYVKTLGEKQPSLHGIFSQFKKYARTFYFIVTIVICYNVAGSLKTYKEKLDSFKESENHGFLGDCDKFKDMYASNTKQNVDETCKTAIKFLGHLKEHYRHTYIDEGCTYLYYWIYFEVLNDEKSTEIAFNFYKGLLKEYDEQNETDTFEKYKNFISEDEFKNLNKLIQLYDKFNNFKEVSISACEKCECVKECVKWYTDYVEECRAGYDTDFCDELENFRDLYNEHMLSENDCVGVEKILPSTRRVGLAFAISIPLVTLLMMSFIFFILYKFTSFGSLLDKMVKKKHIWNDIENDTYKMIHDTGMISHNSENSSYLISYNTSLNS